MVMNGMQVWLRLPEVPDFQRGRTSRTTGKVYYRIRLHMKERWAEEIRYAEQAARYSAPRRFQAWNPKGRER